MFALTVDTKVIGKSIIRLLCYCQKDYNQNRAAECDAGDWSDRCYRCGRRGHIKRDCTASRSVERGSRHRRHRSKSRSHSRHHHYRHHRKSPSSSRSRSRSRSRSQSSRSRSESRSHSKEKPREKSRKKSESGSKSSKSPSKSSERSKKEPKSASPTPVKEPAVKYEKSINNSNNRTTEEVHKVEETKKDQANQI